MGEVGGDQSHGARGGPLEEWISAHNASVWREGDASRCEEWRIAWILPPSL